MPTSDNTLTGPGRLALAAAGLASLAALVATGVWLMEEPPKPRPALGPIPVGNVTVMVGPFIMGSPQDEVAREAWNSDEAQHAVTLTHPFEMQRTEVTQRQWSELLEEAVPDFEPAHRFGACGEDCPAETVSWFEAVAFANLTSIKLGGLPRCYKAPDGSDYTWADARAERPVAWPEGPSCRGYRLPTEAEWEYAARGRGAGRAGATYADPEGGVDLSDIAWYVDNSEAVEHGIDCSDWDWKDNGDIDLCGPQPVGQRQANDLGLYDMLGNVWEWTWDWYGAYPSSAVTDPLGPQEGQKRVLRGCSWYIHPTGCRAAKRSAHSPELRNGNLGFRLVRTLE